jgi:hypothetical protein
LKNQAPGSMRRFDRKPELRTVELFLLFWILNFELVSDFDLPAGADGMLFN